MSWFCEVTVQVEEVERLSISYTLCVISGFRLEVDDNCALLGYYAASKFLPTFLDDLSVPTLKMNPIGLFRNVGKKLPLLAA
jgi:hypothetical protein